MSANGASYHDRALRDICDTKGIDVRKELAFLGSTNHESEIKEDNIDIVCIREG